MRSEAHPTPTQLCRVPVHVGKKLKEVLEAHRPKVAKTAFAREIGRSTKNLYELFTYPSIDSAILAKASVLLNHDFTQYVVGKSQNELKEPTLAYGKAASDVEPIVITVKLDPRDPTSAKKMAAIMKILAGD